eukprot:SAG31_NODE_1644_length_7652_cov_2.702502_4_plen_155_part_00
MGDRDRDGTSSGYTPHTQDVVPTVLAWLLAWEDVSERGGTLWLGKGLPRVWLSPGEILSAQHMPTRGGRIGLEIVSATDSYSVNITVPAEYTWPVGGLRLRLRSPAYPERQILSATLGGKAWPSTLLNATEETVIMPKNVAAADLQSIVVKLST